MLSLKKLIRIAVSCALSASITLPTALAVYPAQVKADALYLRQSPGGDIITTLPHGTKVAVINNSSSWYMVASAGKVGYVSKDYLCGTGYGDFAIATGYIQCDTTVNLRAKPNTSSQILASLPKNTAVNAIGLEQGWYKVTYSGQTGFVHPDYVTFSAPQITPPAQSTSSAATSNAVTYTGTSAQRNSVLSLAAQYLGTPYVYGGSTPSGFDCSGFTSYVYMNTVGTIPRVAQSQYDATNHVTMDELLPGDLVFFGSSPSSISHVGIYVGDGQFIHSPHTGDVIKYSSLTGTYATRFQGGGRVITD